MVGASHTVRVTFLLDVLRRHLVSADTYDGVEEQGVNAWGGWRTGTCSGERTVGVSRTVRVTSPLDVLSGCLLIHTIGWRSRG